MEAGSNNHLIVVGDFMIDRSWVVNAGVPDTVQAHGDVKPMKRIKPSWNSDRLGGAGMTLTALQAMCQLKGYKAVLHGIGIWSADDKELMERLARGHAPSASPGAPVQLHRLETTSRTGCTPITTIKSRFYSQIAEEQPQLIARYDQDPDDVEPKYGQEPLAGLQLPPAASVSAVLIADFNKGTVQPELIGALSRR
jgi:bifunctional ADP-heptose synthase (sugar kinase/adenylyltransferase)